MQQSRTINNFNITYENLQGEFLKSAPTALTKRKHISAKSCEIITLNCSKCLEFFLGESSSKQYWSFGIISWRAAWRTFARATNFEIAIFSAKNSDFAKVAISQVENAPSIQKTRETRRWKA